MRRKNPFQAILPIFLTVLPISTAAQNTATIYGFVCDDSTGTPLVGAAIVLENTKRGTATDNEGRFRLERITAGKQTLFISYIGYQRQRIELFIAQGKTYDLDIRLQRTALTAPEVVVTAARDRFEQQSLSVQPSVIKVSRREITRIPTVGEPDLFRALQILPGVTTPNQASNQLYIRGGSPDQNLVRVDGVRILNPFHLFGLAANINPDLVGQVVVSTGGFSARYGDAISGVVDVESKEPAEKLDAIGNVSLLSSKLLLEGRTSDKLGWLVSGRRSYHDWAARLFKKELPYHFYDLFGKISWDASAKSSFRLLTFYSADVLRVENEEIVPLFSCLPTSIGREQIGQAKTVDQAGFPWSNFALNCRWDYSPSDHLQTRLDVNMARTENTGFDESEVRDIELSSGYSFDEIVECNYYFQDRELDWHVNNNLTATSATLSAYWQAEANINVHAGFETSRMKFDYSWQNFDTEDGNIIAFFDLAPPDFNFRKNYHLTSVFLETIWQPSARLQIQPSLRLEWRHPGDLRTLDPRLSASFRAADRLKIKTALGQYTQGITFLREQGLFGVHELFFPTPFTTSALHVIAGVAYDSAPQTAATLEAYYKTFDNQAIATTSRPDMAAAGGWAYGLEFSLRHKYLNFLYVFAKVKRDFNNTSYFTPWDIRHRLQLIDEFGLRRGWTVSLRWAFQTGQPYTPRDAYENAVLTTYDPRTGQPIYRTIQKSISFPNGAVRYPIYHRLDLTINKALERTGWSMAPYFQIINIYNRKNPLFFEESIEFRENFASEAVPVLKPQGVPILPTFGMRFAF